MDIEALMANYKPVDLGYGQKSQQKKKKKSFLLDQISTAGGILGGIGGSFIAPIAGTAGGAAVGSGLGEALENLISGDRVLNNVGKETALGGVFGAGPLKLLKGGAAGAKALATGGAVASSASKAAMTPLRQKAGQALTGAADDLAVKQFRLTPTQLKNFNQKFGEDAGTVIRKYGFQNADDIATKGIEPLQQQFDAAIQGIPGVTKDSLKKNILSRVNKLSSAGPSDTKALAGQLKKEADAILKPFGDVVDAKELNTIRRQFDDLVNYTEKISNPSRYGVNKRMADAIRDTLQKSDPSGNLKNIGKELQKLRQLSDNAAKQGQLGRGSLPFGLGNMLGAGVGAGAMGGPMGAAGGFAASQLVNSPTGRRATLAGAEKLSQGLLRSGARASGQSPLGIAGRVGASGILRSGQEPSSLEDALVDQSFPNNSETTSMTPTSMNAPMNAAMMGQSSSEMPGLSRDNILEAMLIDIQETGGKNLSKIQTLYEFANPQTEEKPLGGEAQKRALTSQSGLRSLDTLEQTLRSDPGAFQRQALPNPLGITARVTGTTDVRAATDNIVDVIARLRSGAAITDDEAKRFARLLPQPGDSAQSAARKLQNVRMELESFVNPGPALSLEDALMQQGAY